jgi:hypothetical protein
MSRDDPWDRASFDMSVRPEIALRDVSRDDLLIPQGPPTLRMAWLTLVGGASMALLYVWPPLMIVSLATPYHLSASWFWGTVGIAALVLWLVLFTLAVRESRADRRYAEQLHLPG